MRISRRKTGWFLAGVLPCSLTAADRGEAAGAEKVVVALPAVPPVFGGVVALVAKEEGLFKKYGLDADVRSFDSGAAAAQAVVAGNVDLSLSPTPVVVRMVSNGNVNLVGIYGLEHPAWLLCSSAPKPARCADLTRQRVRGHALRCARPH